MSPTGQSGVSVNRRDFAQERVDRPLAAFVRDYPDAGSTGWHDHGRAQLIYATAGVMRVATEAAGYVLPPGRALLVPAGLPHEVRIEGRLTMRALFLRDDISAWGARRMQRGAAMRPPTLKQLVDSNIDACMQRTSQVRPREPPEVCLGAVC